MKSSVGRILTALAFPFTLEFWRTQGVVFSVSSICLIVLWYYLVDKYKAEPTKMRCVFQYISSAAMSLICWPVVVDLWVKYFQLGMDMGKWLQYDSFGYYRLLLNVFLSSLTLDLIFGVIYFRKQMFIMNGWFHHISYIILTLYLMRWRSYNIFLIALPEEIPTYFISTYVLFPQDNRSFSRGMFCITFFIFRIAYHITGYFLLFLPAGNRQTTQLWIPTSLTIFAHCYWYLLWLRKHWRALLRTEEPPYSREILGAGRGDLKDKECGCVDYFDHYNSLGHEAQ
ncbi:transmembrane domain-containing protein [Cryptosporidium canis]|nr:transmembrane domain-containing protein [Cryptosporidium canis]